MRTPRSKSCEGPLRQGLRSAATDASLAHSPPTMQSEEELSKLSPPHIEPLPLSKPNQNKPHVNKHPTSANSSAESVPTTVKTDSPASSDSISPAQPLETSSSQTSAIQGSDSSEMINLVPSASEDKGTDTSDFSPSSPPLMTQESWTNFLDELRSIGKRLTSLEKIEKTTDSLGKRLTSLEKIEKTTDTFSEQLTAVMQRTSEIEDAVKINASSIADVNEQVFSIKTVVQQHNTDIGKLKSMEETIGQHSKALKNLNTLEGSLTKATGKVVDEMRDLVVEQRKQMDEFQSTSKQMKSHTAQMIEEKVQKVKDECDFKSLKKEAYSKRFNLVFTGLSEDPQKDTRSIVKDFITNTMNVKDVNVGTAYRLGSPQPENPSYSRPIVVSFANLAHRNKIWRQRKAISDQNGDISVRVQADLPKKLRKDTQLLYKVMKAASAIPEFQSVRVRDYMIELNGRTYAPSNLEALPKPIRPSTIAMRESEDAIVFFTAHSFMSNHYPSSFNIQGHTFANIEQYLAFKKAPLSGQHPIIQRASSATDPLEAKYILHLLKKDHVEEWNGTVNNILAEGLRAKFTQNKALLDKLRTTQGKVLGEASTNPKWGIGMTLEDENVLDQDKWNESGNLLGKTLVKIRSELVRKDKNKHKNRK